MIKQQGLLNNTDLDKIANLIDTRLEIKLEEKLEEKLNQKLDEKFANYPTKEEAMADKLEILAAIKDFKDKDKAHKLLHSDISEDVPKLQKQVKHLFKTFEIADPTEVVPSY